MCKKTQVQDVLKKHKGTYVGTRGTAAIKLMANGVAKSKSSALAELDAAIDAGAVSQTRLRNGKVILTATS